MDRQTLDAALEDLLRIGYELAGFVEGAAVYSLPERDLAQARALLERHRAAHARRLAAIAAPSTERIAQ